MSGSVSGSPAGQTVRNTVALKLIDIDIGKNLIIRSLKVDNPGNGIAVGKADNKTVLGLVAL